MFKATIRTAVILSLLLLSGSSSALASSPFVTDYGEINKRIEDALAKDDLVLAEKLCQIRIQMFDGADSVEYANALKQHSVVLRDMIPARSIPLAFDELELSTAMMDRIEKHENAAAIFLPIPKNIMESGKPMRLSDSVLRNYFLDVQQRIKAAWFPLKDGKPVRMNFKIINGMVSDLNLRNSSGQNLSDAAAVKAILNAQPFLSLPPGDPRLVYVSITFDYGLFDLVSIVPGSSGEAPRVMIPSCE